MENLQKIFDDLGLKEGNGLYLLSKNNWKKECNFSSRVNRLIEEKIRPDAFFCFGNKPLILFYDSPEDKTPIHKAIWNFNESPIVFIVEDELVEIFNGFNFIRNNNELEKIETNKILTDFSYFQLVTGLTWETYQSKLDKKNRVDFNLLNNIKAARLLLSAIIKEQRVINALIGKIIFIRYLIDREVKIGFEGERKSWTTDDLIHVLRNREKAIDFLKYLQNKFNGDMFPLADKDYGLISQNCFDILIRLLNEDNLGNGQQSHFRLYDFSIIPIEFVSNVYESFIGEENQKNEGAYYTPLFLVDYILAETVEKYFDNKYTYNCRVLDPACGSGIFLVETLRKIIERFIEIHPVLASNPKTFKQALHNLAKNNIFGVDKNLPAIHVAIFSIQLTLLDYQNPSDIEDFRFPPMLETNFFESDFFDTEKPFNKILGQTPPKFILGNPPWKRGKGDIKKPLFDEYIKKRRKKEKELGKDGPKITIRNSEIAQAFLLRVSDFSNFDTQCGLIATSKVLYNLQGKEFRTYFLHNYCINKVFELAPVRHEVFNQSNNDIAIGPAVILFYKDAKEENTDKTTIEHIALKPSKFFTSFKVFSLARNDFKKVEQKKLKDYDWLWKTLVYGSYLDFNFIKRLKAGYPSIGDFIKNESEFSVKQGLKRIDGIKKIDVSILFDWDFLDTGVRRKELQQFFIVPEHNKWITDQVGYVFRNKEGNVDIEVFCPPALLLKDGLTPNFEAVSSQIETKMVFTDNITSIKPFTDKAQRLLFDFEILLNSTFHSYWALQTASFVGIKQERSHDEEKFSIPYITIDESQSIVSEINQLKRKRYNVNTEALSSFSVSVIDSQIRDKTEKINAKIEKIFQLDEIEKSIFNYASKILIPLIKGDANVLKELPINDSLLSDYAQIFLNRFKPTLDKGNQKFIAEIWHSHHIVGMLFKVVPNIPENNKDIVWVKKDNDLILQSLIKLGSQKITDQLFVQKDIRGFEADYFYIFKPNEKRLWHQALGYLDVDEFMDAVLKAGRRGE